MASMRGVGSVLVKYEGEEFSVVERPSPTSAAVVKAKEDMLGTVDLGGPVSDLATVGKFVSIAYNGVASDTKLQIQMRKIGFEIAELYGDSSLVVSKFRRAADSVLTDMTGVYAFFLDGMEDMALTSLESVGDPAKEVATEADKLYMRFNDEKERVLDACKLTAMVKRVHEKEGELAEIIAAFHSAVGALANLAKIMLCTAAFWKNMQSQCDAPAIGKVQQLMVTAVRKYAEDPKKLQKVYESRVLKQHAVKVCVFWSAMESVCSDYTQQIAVSRQELYRYLSENPTLQESRDRIKLLCQEFHDEIERANQKIQQELRQIEKDKEESKPG